MTRTRHPSKPSKTRECMSPAYEQKMTPTHEAVKHYLGIDLSAGRRGPQIGL